MNSSRTELLAAISELCDRYPHWRFGQLVANVAGWTDEEIWDVEDNQLLQAVRLHLNPAESEVPSQGPLIPSVRG